ncbi:MAG: hypothetical protein ACYTGR_05280 [Planctomycetota bacterium]|jgi:hypothetical protein
MPVDTEAMARGVLESVTDDLLVLAVSGTDYRLSLRPTVEAAMIETPPGKRIRGIIKARALRIHGAEGGGRFIEPVYGAPRIVAGTILAIDESASRVLVDVAVPMWVTWPEGQDTSILEVGKLVNFYVESGTSFTPA